ncbi:Phm7p [Coccidioides immitis H538.4]|uniref:Phm7p n=1 Tax=Coccidioides immitis H538.4 TaxID=396776 RepID=A0A0J8RWQ1_COCIT|nr:Phm7p [Coccidioides immitis H538.4]
MDTFVQFAKRADDEDPQNASNSASGLVSTLLPTLVISGAMLLLFVILRRSERRQLPPPSALLAASSPGPSSSPSMQLAEVGRCSWIFCPLAMSRAI